MASTIEEAAKKHIEEIRSRKFAIGAGSSPNPLTNDLHHSVHNLSLELYTKDIHFLMELIQNAEDNEYPEGVEPSLEFILTSKDITGTGAPMTLLVFNNEVGFSRRNIESICSVGQSTKKGRRNEGFVGEKGIGFKSVFLISKQPYIFSNGYQVRFSDEPNQECGIGYIVPEWVNTKPTVADINNVYCSQKKLPTTTIILPLKSEKVKAVKKQLSEVHPELLLFLSKLKQLSVREHVDGLATEDILSSISVSSRCELLSLEGGSTTSYFVQLSAREGICKKCWYYMRRQVFPVNSESKIDGRKEMNEWTITLAFPFNERLTMRALCAGIFAFLPTEMITGFPFIIQADFMLSSSRETILMDNKWNLGILGCVPSMFVAAFVSYSSKQPLQSLPRMFEFLPLIASSYTLLNDIRTTISTSLNERSFLPCEPFSDKKMTFCKPVEAIRVLPEFREVLMRAKDEGMSLECLSTEGRLILHSSIDDIKHDQVLEFLGVNSSTKYGEWYRNCIHVCNLLNLVSADVYLDLMCFIKDTLPIFKFPYDRPFDTPLVKYITRMGDVRSSTVLNSVAILYAKEIQLHSWLSKCNQQFACQSGLLFMSNSMHEAIARHSRGFEICGWLEVHKCVKYTTVEHYIESLLRTKQDSEMVILLSHFLYHSFEEKLVTENDVYSLCASTLPIIDSYGRVHKYHKAILVPSEDSKWMKLFGTNPFASQNYVALGKNIYFEGRDIVGKNARGWSLLRFLEKYMKALDLPDLLPPDVELPISNAHLKEEQAFLLLDWIQHIKSKYSFMPAKFTKSIKCGKWMKTSAGFSSPNQSFLFDGTHESILIEMTKVFANFPIVDESYYKGRITTQYHDVIASIGVKFVSQDSYSILNEQIIHLISSEITRDNTYKLLNYINYSKKHGKLNASLLKALKEKQWFKTTQGYKSPGDCVLVRSKTVVVAQISNLAVVDETFYGEDIHIHLPVLEFLGVVAEIDNVYKKILASFAFPTDLSAMKRETVILLLRLKAIGVKADIEEVAMLLFQTMGWHVNFLVIVRIYSFLNMYNWRPCTHDQLNYQVWIPNGEDTGNWVNSQYCVLSDTGNLLETNPNKIYTLDRYRSNSLPQIIYSTFEVGNMVKSQVFSSESSDPHQIYALDNYYEKPLLKLFSSAFRVRETPSVNDYVTLWKRWVEEQHEVSHDECCIVWDSIVSNWDEKMDFLKANILKLPAFASPSKDKISLMLNSEICIPDDHDLETLFTEASNEPLFAWYPNWRMTSIPAQKLMKIYSDFGVKYLSQLVKFDARSFSSNSKVENRDIREVLIVEGLLRVVLAFLAGPQLRMPLKERHATVKSLLELAVCGTDEPVIIPYILQFPSRKKSIVSRTEQVVFWEKKSHKLFVHRSSFEKSTNHVEFVTYFAQEICSIISQKIVLSNNDLRKMIQISFAYGFELDAVNFILKMENLQSLVEDEEFVSLLISSGSSETKLKLNPSPLSSSTSQRKRVQREEGSEISQKVRIKEKSSRISFM